MACYYKMSLATPGNQTTNATPNTENEVFFIKPGSARAASLYFLWIAGKMAAQSTLSALAARLIKWATAATAGTGITPTPTDVGYQAAKATAASAPTAGTTRTERGVILSTGKTNASQWGYSTVASGVPDDAEVLEAGAAYSFDLLVHSPEASVNYEWASRFAE